MPPPTVLIVEQRAGVRASLRDSLKEGEYRVLEARDGLQALSVCACRAVDLLLIANDLPGIGANALAQKLALPFPATPVLVLRESEEGGALRERIRQALGDAGARRPPGASYPRGRRRSA